MCGIAGFINFNSHSKAAARVRIKRMADAIVHRGPDEEGYYVDDHAALGHRRLSIIDLAGGQQPMGALDGKVQIVFNGEIYNFLDVRKHLETSGHVFSSRSDTEVILNSYLEWGDCCVEKLNGMFGFAIWDARVKRLFLARDRVGKKPLYYGWNRQCFAFASEIKALKAGGFPLDGVDYQALDCYFTLGYVPSPMSIYPNVKKLRAAHTLSVTENGSRETRYWSLGFDSQPERRLDNALEELDSLLEEAVNCRLMSEVPLGAFLSSGLDSTLVVSYMAQALDRPVLTNTIGFGAREYNELPVAGLVANHLGTDHHEFMVEPRALDVLQKIGWHFDEPFADSSALPTWYVCQMARENVTVALSGDGGDEGFGGYTFRYLPHIYEAMIRATLPLPLRGLLLGGIGAVYPGTARMPKPLRLKSIFENLSVSDEEAFYRDLAFLRPDDRSSLYSDAFWDQLKGFTPFEVVRPLYVASNARDPLSRSQRADILLYMTDDVLTKVDRMSMAHSLEVRCPLLDHRILEFAARLPTRFRIDNRQGKILLRRLAAERLPAQVLRQPKQGFSIPAAQWLRDELRPMAEEVVFGNSPLAREMLKGDQLNRQWREHQSGTRDHSVFLWGLMMLGLWERNYVTP